MKNKNHSYKPSLIIDGRYIRKMLHGNYKIVEYYHFSNESFSRKRTVAKGLNLSEAEDALYRLERNKK